MAHLSRPTAPLALPDKEAGHLARFGLTVPTLLTATNPKLLKGQALGHGAAVILMNMPAQALAAAVTPATAHPVAARAHLPALAALAAREGLTAAALAHNGCAWATAGCMAGCLNWSGRGGLGDTVALARGRRTLAMVADPVTHGRAVLWAVAYHYRRAQALGLPLAVRLRGTDEGPRIGWHRLALPITPGEAQALGRRFGLPVAAGDGPGHTLAQALAPALTALGGDGTLTLFDYSKAPLGGPLGLESQRAAGWDITASMAADRATAAADAMAALGAGFRLAVPVALGKGQALPRTLTLGRPVGPLGEHEFVTVPCVNGDLSDHRYRDPHGVAVILRTKRSRGADPATAAPFSLAATGHPQALPDGVATLQW